jgi:hypothetical protein
VTPVAVSATAVVPPVNAIAFTGADLDKEFMLGTALVFLGGLLLLTRRLFRRHRRTT